MAAKNCKNVQRFAEPTGYLRLAEKEMWRMQKMRSPEFSDDEERYPSQLISRRPLSEK